MWGDVWGVVAALAPFLLLLLLLRGDLLPLGTLHLLLTAPPPPLVSIASGWVRGRWYRSSAGRLFAAFLDIPYGEPPVGALRFQRPLPAAPWQGVRECTRQRHFVQRNIFRSGRPREGVEEALALSVYSHNLPTTSSTTSLLPTMVFLHGGGFVSGSGSRMLYGPELLMDRQVVLVTANFRLAVLGNLFLPGAAPGNQMLRDQLLVLRCRGNLL